MLSWRELDLISGRVGRLMNKWISDFSPIFLGDNSICSHRIWVLRVLVAKMKSLLWELIHKPEKLVHWNSCKQSTCIRRCLLRWYFKALSTVRKKEYRDLRHTCIPQQLISISGCKMTHASVFTTFANVIGSLPGIKP